MAIDKAALFAALKPKTEQVTIEGFGTLGIAQLAVSEVDRLRALLKADGQDDKFGLRLVVACVVDDEGARVFSENEDLAALEASSNQAVDLLVSKALEVNGFRKAPDAKN